MFHQGQNQGYRHPRAKVLCGKSIAKNRIERLSKRIEEFGSLNGHEPHLALLLLSDDATASRYAKLKEEACDRAGIRCTIYRPLGSGEHIWVDPIRHVQELIHSLNDNEQVHGISVQFPVPQDVEWFRVFDVIRPTKDVDLLSQYSQGLMLQGRNPMFPPLARAVMHVLDKNTPSLMDRHIAIVSSIGSVVHPLSQMLMKSGAIVTHIKADTPPGVRSSIMNQCDIVIVAMNKPRSIRCHDVRWNSGVIDLGATREGDKTVGDVDLGVRSNARFITPVPGGIGPVQIAMLIENTLTAAEIAVYGGTPKKLAKDQVEHAK